MGKENINHRFWNKVDVAGEDDCWEWTAAKNKDGYGKFAIGNGKWTFSHRYVIGHIEDGFEVMHTCDNRACCNQNHLRIGTHKMNMEDMKKKGRSPVCRGKNNPNVKINENTVTRIRIVGNALSSRRMSKILNISSSQILLIRNNKSWSHIKG